jgi:hypothetical protein
MVVNPHTGEAVLRDGAGNETRIVFTEEAVLAVEQALDMGVLELFERMLRGRAGLGQLQVLVWAGMNAHRSRSGATKALSPERAMKVIRACGGLVGVLPVVINALTACKALGMEPASDDDGEDDDVEDLDPTSGDAGGS